MVQLRVTITGISKFQAWACVCVREILHFLPEHVGRSSTVLAFPGDTWTNNFLPQIWWRQQAKEISSPKCDLEPVSFLGLLTRPWVMQRQKSTTAWAMTHRCYIPGVLCTIWRRLCGRVSFSQVIITAYVTRGQKPGGSWKFHMTLESGESHELLTSCVPSSSF